MTGPQVPQLPGWSGLGQNCQGRYNHQGPTLEVSGEGYLWRGAGVLTRLRHLVFGYLEHPWPQQRPGISACLYWDSPA